MNTNRIMKWQDWKNELSRSTIEKYVETRIEPFNDELLSASEIISAVCRWEGGFTTSELFHYVSEIYGFSID